MKRFVHALCSAASVGTFLIVVLGAPLHDARSGNWPGRRLAGPVGLDALRSGAVARRIERDLEERTTLDDLARPRFNELRFLATGATNPGVCVGPNGWLFLSQRLGEPGDEARAALPRIAAAAGRIAEHLAGQGTRTVVALVPRKQTLHPGETPRRVPRPYVPLYDEVLAALRAASLDVLDLRDALRDPVRPLHLTNDAHWSPDGCHAAGAAIAAHLRALFPAGRVPGAPVAAEFVRMDPVPFVGYEQRLLGFARGGWLDRRFTNVITKVRAAEVGRPGRVLLGSQEPQPILLVGSSMSMAPFWLASQLIGFLGVQIEDHSRDGFAAGYRVVEVVEGMLTRRRPYPEALVWEVPEDFLSREGRYMQEPLESLVAVLDRAPYEARDIPLQTIAVQGVTDRAVRDGHLTGRTTGPGATLLVTLPEPVAGGAGAAIRLEVTVPPGSPQHVGYVELEWGDDPQAAPLRKRRVVIRVTQWLHPVVVPLDAPGGRVVRYVRVRPFNAATPIVIGGFQQWLPRAEAPR